MPADLSEEEFIEREYWCVAPLALRAAVSSASLTLRRAPRRLVEGGEEQVTVDYANDLDTGMCVPSLIARHVYFVADDMPWTSQLRKRLPSLSRST